MKDILPEKYNVKLLVNLLIVILLVVVVGFVIAIFLFGYELTSWDVPGTIIAAPLLAHFFYLLIVRRKI